MHGVTLSPKLHYINHYPNPNHKLNPISNSQSHTNHNAYIITIIWNFIFWYHFNYDFLYKLFWNQKFSIILRILIRISYIKSPKIWQIFPKYWLSRQISKSSINHQKSRFCKKVENVHFCHFLGRIAIYQCKFSKSEITYPAKFFFSPPSEGGYTLFCNFQSFMWVWRTWLIKPPEGVFSPKGPLTLFFFRS